MPRLSRRTLVRAVIALVTVVGAVAAAFDQSRVALVAIVLLAGAAALQATRAVDRAGALSRRLRLADRRARRLERRFVRIREHLIASERAVRRVTNLVRDTRQTSAAERRTTEAMQRRYLAALEKEHMRSAERHRELADVIPRATRTLVSQSVVKHVMEVVRDEARQMEAMLQIVPRVSPRGLLPPSGSWALDARTLAHLVDLVESQRPTTVIEFGSGTSTVYLGYLAERIGAKVVSVEHDEGYGARTRAEVARHGLSDVVEVRLAPLKEQQIRGVDALWYDMEKFEDVTDIELALVDGPPAAVAPRARQHAVPALAPRLAPGALVLLDDAPRPDEQEIARTWIEEHGLVAEDVGVSRLAVLRAPR